MKNSFAGEKNIYYNQSGEFSESINDLKTGNEKINDEAVYDYLLYGMVLPPNTIYKDIRSLFPGEEVKYDNDENKMISLNKEYRELAKIQEKNENVDYFTDRLDEIFEDYFRNIDCENTCLLLSGGLDSSIIASYLPKDAVCVTVSGRDNTTSSTFFAKKTTDRFKLRNSLTVYFDYQKDEKLCKEIISNSDNPIPAGYFTYIRIAQKLKKLFQSDKIILFTGENADVVSSSVRPTTTNYFLSKINRLTYFTHLEKISKINRNLFLLSTSNPVELMSFFWSFRMYPGPWINVPKSYFIKKQKQIENQIGKKIKTFNDFILMDELIAIRRDQSIQNYLFSIYGINLTLPYYDKEVVKLFLEVPQRIRRRQGFGKVILKKLAYKRGVPKEVIGRSKNALIYDPTFFIQQKMHLPIWDEMEKNTILNSYINIKLIRKKHQDNFLIFDILRGLHCYFNIRLKLS